ncbi:MAG: hypothetical protein RBT37_07075 [Dissulfurispiraceae bacterium]|jgi:phenylacetate-CoA ligase|nr:hypothetical protein [Dissulfurispiraceae bacterium]
MKSKQFSADWYAPIARLIIAPLWARHEKSLYLKHLKYFEKSQFRPLDEVRADQLSRLKKLVLHAYSTTSYYKKLFDSAGIKPEDIRTLEDIQKIPLLTKDDIRANRDDIISSHFSKDDLIIKKTSGSTGVSLELYCDEESGQWKRGCAIRHDQWTGWRLGERVGAVWGNPEYKKNWRGYIRNALLERFTYLDTLKMDSDSMHIFYEKIRRKKPTLLFGHAHSLYLFARFLEKNSLDDIRPKGIISTAMVLHDYERRLIEQVFGCRVTNRYGCEEVSLIACECSAHNGLHINMDTLVVELVRDGKPAAPGEPGAIVVTDLTNYGMPMIRYKVGDVGILSDLKTCECSCSYPIIESLEGRVADYVVTAEGNYISGISLTENFAMLLTEGVKQLQIIQESIDHLIFKVVKGEGFNDTIPDKISKLVEQRFGRCMTHSIEYVDSIQQEHSGKYRFCISKIRNPFS